MNAISDIYSIYGIYKTINQIKNNPNEPVSRDTCQKLRQQIVNGGCIYIKFTQWLISKLRSDQGRGIDTLVASLDSLFDQCPYHDIEHTRAMFRQSFGGQEIESQVSDLELIASGSVGQVYRAVLNKPFVVCTQCDAMVTTRLIPTITETNTAKTILICNCPPIADNSDTSNTTPSEALYEGQPRYVKVIRKVAIKVKHPDIDKQIADKMQVFQFMARLQKVRWIKNLLSLHVDFKDFMDNLIRQADFQEELRNNRQLRNNFRDNHLVYFPLALTASRDVLISEYVSGQSIDNIGEYYQMKCCLNYASMVAQMVLIDNFCHADLHRGNWCISLGPIPNNKPEYLDASTVHLPQDLDSYLEHDASKENAILHIKGDLRHGDITPHRSPHADSINDKEGAIGTGDYAIIVFDAGICFSNSDITVNRKIWEAFERSNLDYLMEIVDYIVVGNYDETIKKHVKEIMIMFRDDFTGVLPMFDKLNEVLVTYNCCLSTIALNITILFALINETLEKHNLLGTQGPAGSHNDIVRAKMLDLICYGRSRGIYSKLTEYLREKENIRHNDLVELDAAKLNTNNITEEEDDCDSVCQPPSTTGSSHSSITLFGKACSSSIVFGNPDDLMLSDSDSDNAEDDKNEEDMTPTPEQ